MGLYSGNSLYLHSGDVWFESVRGQLVILFGPFSDFPQFSGQVSSFQILSSTSFIGPTIQYYAV